MPRAKQYLDKAKFNTDDECYTRIGDIEDEMWYYANHFKNKVVYCNCDDPKQSKFYQHFTEKFETYGLKKLITTCYKSDDLLHFSKHKSKKSLGLHYDGKRSLSLSLDGDGDFRSPECVDLLKQADIVVTNPPFSLFREYLPQLIKHKKKFIVLGNMNAFAYKEIFPLFRDRKCWYGVTGRLGAKYFVVPEGRPHHKIVDGIPLKSATVQWFTNLNHNHYPAKLDLWAKYNSLKNPKYDNYDAIEVGKTIEIPYNYDGVMGVPISFMDKYNPDQFEIVGWAKRNKDNPMATRIYSRDECNDYGDGKDLNAGPVLRYGSKLNPLFVRILIRRK